MMSREFIYTMTDLRKVHPGGKEVLKSIYLSFFPGAKIGVLGANGSGKSTLLRIMAGLDTEFLGEAFPKKGIRIGYLAQEPELDEDKTVKENVEHGLKEVREALDTFNALSEKFAEPMSDDEMEKLLAKQGRLQDVIDAQNGWEIDRTLDVAMDALRCPPGDTPVNVLSGGERRRVALCRLLLSRPDMLLLDEPTNHLDAESVAWLERFLHDFEGTVVAVTHDRYFLDNVAGWILELDRGEGIPWEGNYSSWLEQKEKRLKAEEKTESSRQRALAREREWVSQSPKARQAKQKARIARYDELLQEQLKDKVNTAEIYIPPGKRLGNVVVNAESIRKAFGEKLLVDDLNFRLPPGGVVGIIGANGAGKTTLFKMIAGVETPDGGNLVIGETVDMMYVDQSRADLSSEKTLYEEISGGQEVLEIGPRSVNARAYCSAYNFKGSDQQKKVGTLSGGERNRVHLAKLLRQGGNLLLLDEPTNDLDVETLRALENAILGFPGCAVVISHDRWFLDRIATHILAFEGDSNVVWFEGNYQDYEKDRKKRLGDIGPTRIKYRPLPNL
ncbi:MAG: energy-dependent translational throttle protein EttA [Deltaproteobacteria bacterium]|nr:energy-dependent translational throttle protein EttA [Deltaproteobacteria bacterium]